MLFTDPHKKCKVVIEALRDLVEGCKKHPAYRNRRKPLVPCKRCEDLWDICIKLKEYQEEERRWWRTSLEADQKRMKEESDRREAYLNSPG